jgi:hypothetical protein
MTRITATADLRMCHHIDEEWIHPECKPGGQDQGRERMVEVKV